MQSVLDLISITYMNEVKFYFNILALLDAVYKMFRYYIMKIIRQILKNIVIFIHILVALFMVIGFLFPTKFLFYFFGFKFLFEKFLP
jgi:hypothetical protein